LAALREQADDEAEGEPPTCAHQATPPKPRWPTLRLIAPLKNCRRNHTQKNHRGQHKRRPEENGGMTASTRAWERNGNTRPSRRRCAAGADGRHSGSLIRKMWTRLAAKPPAR